MSRMGRSKETEGTLGFARGLGAGERGRSEWRLTANGYRVSVMKIF